MKLSNLTKGMMLSTLLVITSACGKAYKVADDASSGSVVDLSKNGDMNFTESTSAPSVCGSSSICFGGKSLTFTNDSGNSLAISIASVNATSFTAAFRTPSGRTMNLNFQVDNGQLVVSTPQGWQPQFCYHHNSSACQTQTTFGVMEYNCASALHWSGSYAGDTSAQATVCQ